MLPGFAGLNIKIGVSGSHLGFNPIGHTVKRFIQYNRNLNSSTAAGEVLLSTRHSLDRTTAFRIYLLRD